MKSINRVTLLGNVGRDPEVKVLTGGNAVAEFSLATSRGGYTKDGKEVPQVTQWHRIKAFGAITSSIEKYVKKGSTLYVEGRIEYREYEKDGQKRTVTEIILEDMSQLSQPQQAAPQPTYQQPQSFPQHQPMGAPVVPSTPTYGSPPQSDGLPF